ncbi:UNVERIFIED_CONTAM: hypothetical protein RMT77_007914 [Armadillidium vulgare]
MEWYWILCLSLIFIFIIILVIFCIWLYQKRKKILEHQERNELPLYLTSNDTSTAVLSEGSLQVDRQILRSRLDTDIRSSIHSQNLLLSSQRLKKDSRPVTKREDVNFSYPQMSFKSPEVNNGKINERMDPNTTYPHASSSVSAIYDINSDIFEQSGVPTIDYQYTISESLAAGKRFMELQVPKNKRMHPNTTWLQIMPPSVDFYNEDQEYLAAIEAIRKSQKSEYDRIQSDTVELQIAIQESLAAAAAAAVGDLKLPASKNKIIHSDSDTTYLQNRISPVDLHNAIEKSLTDTEKFPELQESVYRRIYSDTTYSQNGIPTVDLHNIIQESPADAEEFLKLQKSEYEKIHFDTVYPEEQMEESSSASVWDLKLRASKNKGIHSDTTYLQNRVSTVDHHNAIEKSLADTEEFPELQESVYRRIYSDTTHSQNRIPTVEPHNIIQESLTDTKSKLIHSNTRSHTPSSVPSIHLKYGTKNLTDIIFEQNGLPTIDLHGMTIQESLAATEGFLEFQKSEYSRAVQIITGRGLHSTGGISKIKPAVMNYLFNEDFRFSDINKGGALLVLL